MKCVLLVSLLVLLSVSSFSQKVNVKIIRSENAALSEWQILDEQNQKVVSMNDFLPGDSITFSLDANKRYSMHISVSEVLIMDTVFYVLVLNEEPIIRIGTNIGTGDHYYPFFTGVRNREPKIVGGTSTTISEFPWQIFYISGNFRCGGSMISNNWIVTAAHCTQDDAGVPIPVDSMSIKVGGNNPYNSLDGKIYKVSEVIVHEGFNSATLLNDIALLRIGDTINFPNAVPIKLVTDNDVTQGALNPGVMSWVTGWGLVNVVNQTVPTALQKVQLPLITSLQASTVWGPIPATDLMAGYLNGNKDACNGDSGGPLVVPFYGEYKLAGIVSWGSQTCDTYGAYTRVSDFGTWISSKTGIPQAFLPPSPIGDSIICQGVESTQYLIENIPSATSYEWQLFPSDAGVIAGNTRNASVIWDVSKTGTVEVLVRVTINNVVSDWARHEVQIVKNTRLLSQSPDTTLCAEKPVTLMVGAEGYNLVYNWYKNNNIVQTGPSAQISFLNSTVDNSGSYKSSISGTCGTVISSPVNLTVLPLTNISGVSPDTEVPFGNDITLDVTATGHNLVYQWEKDRVFLSNTNSPQLVLHNLNTTDIGQYQSIVTGTCGVKTSDSVYVYVKRANSTDTQDVFVWPTVTSSLFNVALSNSDPYTIVILNSMGKLMQEETNCYYQTVVNIEKMPKGLYLINVSSKNFRKTIKLIKI
jgi:Trypsin/PKD-like domain